MMRNIILVLIGLCSFSLLAQNTPEEIEVVEINENSEEVPFQVIENVPIYKNCDENLSNNELKKCMSQSISELIIKKFNINVARGLGLPDGIVKMMAIFKINKDGEVTDIKVRGPHPVLEKEAYEAIKSIPKFTRPGIQRGKPVIVPYSLPIAFNIDNSLYLSKKERKKLKNKKELP